MPIHNSFQETIFVLNFWINREDGFYFFLFKILNERCKSNLKSLGHFQAQLACPPPLGPRQTNWLRKLCTIVSVHGLICNIKLTDNPHYYSLSYFKRPPCFIPIGVPSLPHNANISKLAVKKKTNLTFWMLFSVSVKCLPTPPGV